MTVGTRHAVSLQGDGEQGSSGAGEKTLTPYPLSQVGRGDN